MLRSGLCAGNDHQSSADCTIPFSGAAAVDRQGEPPSRIDVAEWLLLGHIPEAVRPDGGQTLFADADLQRLPGGQGADGLFDGLAVARQHQRAKAIHDAYRGVQHPVANLDRQLGRRNEVAWGDRRAEVAEGDSRS